MAVIEVTVPASKIPLVRAMILDRTGQDMSDPEIVTWLEDWFVSKLKNMSRQYQRSLYEEGFTFDDPTIP